MRNNKTAMKTGEFSNFITCGSHNTFHIWRIAWAVAVTAVSVWYCRHGYTNMEPNTKAAGSTNKLKTEMQAGALAIILFHCNIFCIGKLANRATLLSIHGSVAIIDSGKPYNTT